MEKNKKVETFEKRQIVASKRYEKYLDFLNGNLEDRQYSLEEVDTLLVKNKMMKGKGK